MQLGEVKQAEGGRMTVCWDRCALCLHEVTAAAVAHSHVIVICSNTKRAREVMFKYDGQNSFNTGTH